MKIKKIKEKIESVIDLIKDESCPEINTNDYFYDFEGLPEGLLKAIKHQNEQVEKAYLELDELSYELNRGSEENEK